MALLDNLAAHWKLNEGSGTRNDSHGTNHLTDNNTVLSGTGKIGDAADFERDNSEWLSCASNADLQSGDVEFYLAFWFNAESLPGDMGLVGKWVSGGFEYLVEWIGNTLYWWYGSSVFATKAYSSTGTWTFVECYHDPTANQIGIALNGGAFTTAALVGGNTVGAGDFKIGHYGGGAAYFDGLIDGVWLWKRLLTAPERAEIYNGGAGLDYPASAIKASWWAWNQFAGKA